MSFKRAAAELSVTPTAISHQIRSLEEHTGLVLFGRQVRKVVLTEAGAQLYPVLRDGFDAFEATLDRLVQIRKRARVTISATNAFTAKWLVPRVARFHALHPDIDLQLHASDEAVGLADNGVDIAIRYGRGPYPGLSAEVMFADDFAPVANPLFGALSIEDLSRVPLIHFQWRRNHPLNPTWERWYSAAGIVRSQPQGQLYFSDESHAVQAAVAGQGIALLSLALVRDELQAGHLVQPFGPTVPGHTYHMVMNIDPPPGASVPAAAEWLRAEIARG
jgi:LysR family glycine cleavage system transcriptional activator